MTWKLHIDDQLDDPETPNRWTPAGFLGAKSSSAACDLVDEHGMPEFIGFDFDLGGVDTSASFLYALQRKFPKGPFPEYKVHSRNPYAKEWIRDFINSWKKSAGL